MINLRENIWAWDVPDPEHAVISGNTITWSSPGAVARGFMVLPPGQWEIVCTSKEATEEQAAAIVQHSLWWFPEKHIRYIDYAYPFDTALKQKWDQGFGKAIQSLNSLLASKGCDLNKNYLIIKKQ
jgi:hypothetical protein